MILPSTPSFSLEGKRALVTGASSGIGQACAVAMAEAGAKVVCAARGSDRLNQTVTAMVNKGLDVEALVLDQTDLNALKSALNNPYDIVINSAGMARHNPALDTLPEDFDAVMNLNLRSAYFLSSYAATAMNAANISGSIIHISSQMGHVGGIDRTVYSASKHALEGMVKSMAIEWGKLNIRINTICPTFIRTPLTQSTFDNPERAAFILGKIKLGRVGEVHDIMGAAVYLASDASSLVTGTHLIVDGGWTAE
ncbi:MAG: SDR family oxidoreductase [Amylibacter sp.]|nr:SDR family oxidoreductase [Amylibacter sp.]|tara:strand:- start:596 stop:1354 length:759 start_codon:yes stop_codon:yes gene_type:complete